MSLAHLDAQARGGSARSTSGEPEGPLDAVLPLRWWADEHRLDPIGRRRIDIDDPHAQVELQGDGQGVEARSDVADRRRHDEIGDVLQLETLEPAKKNPPA